MNLLKTIFARIWAAWAIIWFVITMLLFYIPFLVIYTLEEPRKTSLFIRYSKGWMNLFLPFIGCPLTVNGKHHFKKGENYIVVFNHNSLMDVPVTCPYVPGGNKTIAKTEFTKAPLFGLLYRIGSVLVDRKSEKSRKESYAKMKQVLGMGLHMCIYPEGTRNLTPEPLKQFHDGAFRLSGDTGKMIVPTLIFHTRKVMPAGKGFYLWPHALRMDFLEPVGLAENETVAQLRERVFNIMKNYYVSQLG